jgi:hypothetical protein
VVQSEVERRSSRELTNERDGGSIDKHRRAGRGAWMHRTKQQLDLLDLFPAASTSTSAPVLVDAPSVVCLRALFASSPLAQPALQALVFEFVFPLAA